MTPHPTSTAPRSSATALLTGAPPARYRVWAPSVNGVVLHVGDAQEPMTRSDAGGWWTSARIPRHGDRYAFSLDDRGPFPDPRSLSQPDGVHGWSEWIEHERFTWSDAAWQAPPLASAVLYELHVGTFSEAGTFAGAIPHLPHLVDLGVTHVELMPVPEFPGRRGWGYDGVDLFAPHHGYGGSDGLKQLVDACHRHGLAVLLDVVYNHLGPDGNYLQQFGPYFTSRYHTPWGQAVNLDGPYSDEVRAFLLDNVRTWLRDYHVDGLRLDAVHAFLDTSATHLLESIVDAVERLEAALGRHLVVIAESDLNDPRLVRSREAGGYGLDAQWSDDFHHALHARLTGERTGYYEDFGGTDDLAGALTRRFVYGGRHSRHRRRVHGRPAQGLPGWRFVVAAQNHDQIGNRARGERLAGLVSPGRLKIAAALLLTSPFVPLLFQGEEWAASTPFLYFTSHEDPSLAALVRDGRRREFAAFGWDPEAVPDPEAESTFTGSRLVWDEARTGTHAELLAWHRALIALRRQLPALRDGDVEAVAASFDDEGHWLVVARQDVRVCVNLGEVRVTLPLDTAGALLLASDPRIGVRGDALDLPAESVAIVRLSA